MYCPGGLATRRPGMADHPLATVKQTPSEWSVARGDFSCLGSVALQSIRTPFFAPIELIYIIHIFPMCDGGFLGGHSGMLRSSHRCPGRWRIHPCSYPIYPHLLFAPYLGQAASRSPGLCRPQSFWAASDPAVTMFVPIVATALLMLPSCVQVSGPLSSAVLRAVSDPATYSSYKPLAHFDVCSSCLSLLRLYSINVRAGGEGVRGSPPLLYDRGGGRPWPSSISTV